MSEPTEHRSALPRPTTGVLGALRTLDSGEWVRAIWWAVPLFLGLGTLTALWPNPWFVRMTPLRWSDLPLLAANAALLGLFLGLRAPGCALSRGNKPASLGGLLTFLGFGCVLCNQALLLLFSAAALLAWVEPLRPWLGLLGVAVLLLALRARLRERATHRA